MTDEQINVRIAEACGWEDRGSFDHMFPENHLYRRKVNYGSETHEYRAQKKFAYCNDLNEMHEAEKFILKGFEDDAEGSELWQDYMVYVVCAAPAYLSHHATARQKAKAFLQTFGKWEEAK